MLTPCLYINLESRTDRNENVQKELKKLNIAGERFNAVKLANGALGCTMSHIKCLEIAKERDYESVFICEDDIEFLDPAMLQKQLEQFRNTIPDWDVCIVSGNNGPPFQPINEACVRVYNCQTTTGYVVKKHYYDVLIENFRESASNLMKTKKVTQFALDVYWKRLQQQGDKWYLIIPVTAVQRKDYSDIEKRVVDYRYAMTLHDKSHLLRRK